MRSSVNRIPKQFCSTCLSMTKSAILHTQVRQYVPMVHWRRSSQTGGGGICSFIKTMCGQHHPLYLNPTPSTPPSSQPYLNPAPPSISTLHPQPLHHLNPTSTLHPPPSISTLHPQPLHHLNPTSTLHPPPSISTLHPQPLHHFNPTSTLHPPLSQPYTLNHSISTLPQPYTPFYLNPLNHSISTLPQLYTPLYLNPTPRPTPPQTRVGCKFLPSWLSYQLRIAHAVRY
jgi:hypothetical protein